MSGGLMSCGRMSGGRLSGGLKSYDRLFLWYMFVYIQTFTFDHRSMVRCIRWSDK